MNAKIIFNADDLVSVKALMPQLKKPMMKAYSTLPA